MKPLATLLRALGLSLTLLSAEAAPQAGWQAALKAQVERIEKQSSGSLGVYVKRLDNGESFGHRADRAWYLSSSAKVPIAIAVLQEIEAGRHGLKDRLTLQASDKIEGAGNLVWQADGSVYAVDALLKRMLLESDNTAANMLIRPIGEDTLNRRVRELLGDVRLTNLTQVRRDVYAELHPGAAELSNLDLVKIAAAPPGPQRVEALRRRLAIKPADLRLKTLDEAYARYYARNFNSATLESYAGMLERLVRGKLLSPANMALLYRDMRFDTNDGHRLRAGLPKTHRFIGKTGTQFKRYCHMGVVDPQDGGRNAVVVAVCAEGLGEASEGPVFEGVGRAIAQTLR